MKIIAATCAIIFTMWSVIAALTASKTEAIIYGCVAGLCAVAFVSLAARDEFHRTADWFTDADDDVNL